MKLEGVKVIDLSMFLPGPVVTQIMADHGARVIRIEPPGGEPSRGFGPFDESGESIWYRNTHRGKRSLELDLKTPEDRATLIALAKEADVFIEGFRAGVVKKLGVDAETLCGLNPRLIYCSLSAFGQTGPLSVKASHDMGAQAFTGFLALNDNGDEKPVVPGMPSADMASALTGLNAILMALFRRETTGKGDIIDANMYDSLMAWTAHLSGPVFDQRIPPTTRTHRSIGGSAFYNIYETADGRHIALTGRELKFAGALLKALGREELFEFAKQDPGPDQQQLIAEMQAIFKQRNFEEWREFLADVEVSWAPILNMAEAFDHPHARAREMLFDDGTGTELPGTPVKFENEPGQVRTRAPKLNEFADSVASTGWDFDISE
ncbi:L-carnitine dehydrogenase, putative [Luminiphilus syltensis NOR5-1B]|uniref:L-carnitine dehydrogenase, putative n=1 Tax=Luminiphilus syltensis NOR5-1B TaxID=565045 RepID=B8KU02_9GAMM|nr:CoA transferase [Luminiphilus syltensis]EED34271.1 L-carnitine dehydrogenase, putative [Luminiphilus syltensis NOR5-1B]